MFYYHKRLDAVIQLWRWIMGRNENLILFILVTNFCRPVFYLSSLVNVAMPMLFFTACTMRREFFSQQLLTSQKIPLYLRRQNVEARLNSE